MEKRSGYAAIIGRPNVGKSTLMNAIIGMKIAITSSKPQTTRNRIKTVYTEDRGQIVFLDTPGLHKSKNRLGDFMMRAASRALKEADLILWLVEASDYIGPGDRRIAEMLEQVDAPVILVINKIDRVKKPELLGIIDAFSKLRDFNEIIPVSALKGDGRDELVDTMFSYMPQGEPFYDEDTVTDMMERDICAELVREQALRLLSDEIPHGVAVTIESMKEEPDITHVEANIYCEKESHKGIIIGKQGGMLKKIGTAARHEMEELLECRVNLKLWVKVKKDWRDSEKLVGSLGYQETEEKP